MQITTLRLKNFQSFGSNATVIDLGEMRFVLGPNGAGKTAVLEAMARLFSPLAAQRAVRLTDFHAPFDSVEDAESAVATELWIEVDIEFPEAGDDSQHASVPPNFRHMRLESEDSVPKSRVRLTASTNEYGEVVERIEYILEVDDDGEPIQVQNMTRSDRGYIEVHYLPARRDPGDHISYAASALVGRTLRAADWAAQQERLTALSEEVSAALGTNVAVASLSGNISNEWNGVHKGQFFKNPAIAFGHGDIDSVLRQLTITFSPSHHTESLPFDRLSDGQKSLLYISLVLAWQKLSRLVIAVEVSGLYPDKLRPPVHTILALEEPENSLAPQYLGRVIRQLRKACGSGDAQALIATHAPALLRRADPEDICFLRLDESRTTTVRRITIPDNDEEAAKYLQEAVRAYPELYFSRLVVLGEGASELVVLPRILAAEGVAEDDASVSVVPLGGRHVNHFWRLLDDLQIPYVTLLDLDSARNGGGWGRVRNARKQVNKLKQTYTDEAIEGLPKWDDGEEIPRVGVNPNALGELETSQGVFFSWPVDLDLMMMEAFPAAYGVRPREPEEKTIPSVLGKKHGQADLIGEERLNLLEDYREKFGQQSKPSIHLAALSELDDTEILAGLPDVLQRLVQAVRNRLAELPE